MRVGLADRQPTGEFCAASESEVSAGSFEVEVSKVAWCKGQVWFAFGGVSTCSSRPFAAVGWLASRVRDVAFGVWAWGLGFRRWSAYPVTYAAAYRESSDASQSR